MHLSPTDIAALLGQQAITDEWPWNTSDEAVIHQHIKEAVDQVKRSCGLLDKTESGHYGSGYASFVDCWLYREDDAFRSQPGNGYWGLVVLFSTLSHYYVIGQGEKTWHERSSSSYLPEFEMVDQITQPAVQSIIDSVCQVLDERGLVRALSDELSELLPPETCVPTILTDPPFRHFDALFYWED